MAAARLLRRSAVHRVYTPGVMVGRAVPDVRSERPAATRDFFVRLLGFEVAMDLGWVVTVASPTNPAVQVTIVGNDDMAPAGGAAVARRDRRAAG
jgi:hypothetical protein